MSKTTKKLIQELKEKDEIIEEINEIAEEQIEKEAEMRICSGKERHTYKELLEETISKWGQDHAELTRYYIKLESEVRSLEIQLANALKKRRGKN